MSRADKVQAGNDEIAPRLSKPLEMGVWGKCGRSGKDLLRHEAKMQMAGSLGHCTLENLVFKGIPRAIILNIFPLTHFK